MKYNILRTEKASEQLRDILMYGADVFGVEKAISYLDEIEDAIFLLEDSPYLGTEPRYSILRKQGYRVLIIQKHLVFYKVNEDNKTGIIYAIVDSRTNYINLL